MMDRVFTRVQIVGRHREDGTRQAKCPYCGSLAETLHMERPDGGWYAGDTSYYTFSPCEHTYARTRGRTELELMNPAGRH